MRQVTVPACALSALFLLPALAWADEKPITSLVGQLQNASDSSEFRKAFMELNDQLLTAPPETVSEIQHLLCQMLWTCNEPRTFRRLALVLMNVPCEEAVVTLARRLDPELPEPLAIAICHSLHAVAEKRPSLSPATISLALTRLETITRKSSLPSPLIDSAVMATGALGSPGFEQLVKLKDDPKTPPKAHHVLLTAISETDDPRALAVLRQAAGDTANPDSRRAHAIYGIGRMFSRAASKDQTFDPTERNACIQALRKHLTDTASDRIFCAAIKALSQMVDFNQDLALQQIVRNAVRSPSQDRREAALDALYQQRSPLAPEMAATVRSLADSDSSPAVRSAAAAVLDNEQLFKAQ